MALDLTTFDPADHLGDAASLAAYIEDALDDGDPGEFLEALGVIARAKGMTEIAKQAGVAARRSTARSKRPDTPFSRPSSRS